MIYLLHWWSFHQFKQISDICLNIKISNANLIIITISFHLRAELVGFPFFKQAFLNLAYSEVSFRRFLRKLLKVVIILKLLSSIADFSFCNPYWPLTTPSAPFQVIPLLFWLTRIKMKIDCFGYALFWMTPIWFSVSKGVACCYDCLLLLHRCHILVFYLVLRAWLYYVTSIF